MNPYRRVSTAGNRSGYAGVAAIWLFTIVAVAAVFAFTWGGVVAPHSAREVALKHAPETTARSSNSSQNENDPF